MTWPEWYPTWQPVSRTRLRKLLKLEIRDPVEIFTEGNQIILRKYAPSCTFCQNTEDLVSFKGQNICAKCLQKLAVLADD